MRRWFAWMVLGLGLPACTHGSLVGGGPVSAPHDVPEGTLRYYVGKHVVMVTGTFKERWEPLVGAARKKEGNAKDETAEERPIEFHATTSWTGQVDLQVVPDTGTAFWLQYVPGDSSDDVLTVNLGGNGILGSLDIQTTPQAGEILKNVATFAGIAVGALAGAKLRSGEPWRVLNDAGVRPLTDPDGDELRSKLLDALNDEKPSDREREKATRILEEQVVQMPPLWEATFMDAGGQRALRLFVHQVYLDAVIASRQRDRIDLQRQIPVVPHHELADLLARLTTLGTSIDALALERTATARAFASEMDAFLAYLRRMKCGQEDHEDRVVRLLELRDLPPQAVVGAVAGGPADLASADVRENLAKARYAHAKELLESAHVLLTLDMLPGARSTSHHACATDTHAGATGAPTARVYYRQSRPAVLRVWEPRARIAGEDAKCRVEESLVVTSQRIVDVLDPSAAPEYVEFEPHAFAKSHMALTLDAGGRLTAMTQDSSSSLKELTGALSGGATAFRDQYSQTLRTAGEIEDSKRKLLLADLQTDVERTKKEKEKLDAEVALAGASAPRELLEQQALLAAQLKVAQDNLALEKFQTSGATQVQTDATTQEVNRLTAEVNLLRQQIELLKQQQILDALRKKE